MAQTSRQRNRRSENYTQAERDHNLPLCNLLLLILMCMLFKHNSECHENVSQYTLSLPLPPASGSATWPLTARSWNADIARGLFRRKEQAALSRSAIFLHRTPPRVHARSSVYVPSHARTKLFNPPDLPFRIPAFVPTLYNTIQFQSEGVSEILPNEGLKIVQKAWKMLRDSGAIDLAWTMFSEAAWNATISAIGILIHSCLENAFEYIFLS
jgi:hypothetical protein